MKNISEIAKKAGIEESELTLYGSTKAKVDLKIEDRIKSNKSGKYILVTAITPTPHGEGKTTTLLGITQALGSELNENVIACIRQPSMAPTFNIKGGGAGGGKSLVVPVDEINLGLTGDIHTITAAHNLVAAALDTRMYHESRQSDEALASRGIDKRLDIDPDTVTWNRVMDVCDRSLRDITVGHNDDKMKDGSKSPVFPRETKFDLTAASELMAILALATSLEDIRNRISKVIVALDKKGGKVTIDDLGLTGAITALMKDTLKPNLVQTIEGQPVFVHAGPFANIAHGNSSIIADKIATKLADYVITEAGFAADMGMEKFFNIKCRYSGLKPDVVVLVATIRALKYHGKDQDASEIEKLKSGLENLKAHIKNAKKYGVTTVVGINKFEDDTDEEIEIVKNYAIENGALDVQTSTHFMDGGKGAVELARSIIKASEEESDFKFLYDLNIPIKQKIEKIAKEMYSAASVEYSDTAEKQIENFENLGLGELPICMAKTPLSISHDPNLKGAPSGFVLPIREVRQSAGAGFIYPLIGDLATMPGLATRPSFMDIDVDLETEEITGITH